MTEATLEQIRDGWNQAAKLTASDFGDDNGEQLGTSVGVSSDGSTIVAGAPGAAINSQSDQGAAYVFASCSS